MVVYSTMQIVTYKNGSYPDPPKVEDIKVLKSPTNEAELLHVLGMMAYMNLFIIRLSEHTVELGDLLKCNAYEHREVLPINQGFN